mgnify:CR=1 FL=1|jgi:hypothetical protein
MCTLINRDIITEDLDATLETVKKSKGRQNRSSSKKGQDKQGSKKGKSPNNSKYKTSLVEMMMHNLAIMDKP